MTDVEEQQLEAAIRLVQALGGGYLPATIDIPADSTKKDQNSRTPS
jgi:hypothetical protein